jgi:hypothetical protein
LEKENVKAKDTLEFERNDAIELFRVLRSLSAFVQSQSGYGWEAASETAAMILLSRLGLAAPISDDDDAEGDDTSWVLTVEGNERLAGLLTELRQWDPDSPASGARRRRVERAQRMSSGSWPPKLGLFDTCKGSTQANRLRGGLVMRSYSNGPVVKVDALLRLRGKPLSERDAHRKARVQFRRPRP